MLFFPSESSWRKLTKIPLFPLVLIVLIASLGFCMLYSAGEGSGSPWALKQMTRFGVGLVLLVATALVDIRTWMFLAYPLYALTLILLVGVEIMGVIGMGARRWIDLSFLQLQPSELMKIALVLALARYFQMSDLQEIRRPTHLIPPLCFVGIPMLLVMRQPDLGTALLLGFSGMVLFFLAGVRLWKFAVGGGAFLALLPVLWSRLHEYQKKRVLIFLNPDQDPSHSGYHVTQSKIALGSGGWTGKGFMKGSQSHLNFLPEKQTDFIFTMFGEEFGFCGALVLLGLYILLIGYGYKSALKVRHHFGQLVVLGMTTILFLYTFINISMVMGMLPVVGVPLPLFSYGGTALLTLMIGQGIILSAVVYQDVRIGRG